MPTLTIRIDEELDALLTELAQARRCTKSELVRRMLMRQTSVELFDEVRKEALPLAERVGYLTDDDVFRDLS